MKQLNKLEQSEQLIRQLQDSTGLDRVDLLVTLANTVADGLLSTPTNVLEGKLRLQTNRLVFRKMKNVLNTLEKLNFLRFG